MKRILFFIISILLFVFLLNSCSIERRILGEFVEDITLPAVLLIPPEVAFKNNLKPNADVLSEDLSKWQQDSVSLSQSALLKNLEDETLIEEYYSSMLMELQRMGFEVFTQSSMSAFLDLKIPAFFVNIAQIQLEESFMDLSDDSEYSLILDAEDLKINMMSVNSWFEIAKLNDSTEQQELLYASNYINDYFSGRIREYPSTGQVKYSYSYEAIDEGDIYDFVSMLGERYASYIYDYFMNEYLFRKTPEGERTGTYYHFDHRQGVFEAAGDNRFIFM